MMQVLTQIQNVCTDLQAQTGTIAAPGYNHNYAVTPAGGSTVPVAIPGTQTYTTVKETGLTLILPSASQITGNQAYTVKAASGVSATVQAPGSTLIDGSATYALTSLHSVTVLWNGTSWDIVAKV